MRNLGSLLRTATATGLLLAGLSAPAAAQDPFIGEIRWVPYSFAPRGWASCDGQLLPIAQNTALFSLLGTTYGGNGQTTFALPDMRGRMPVHVGMGPGLSDRTLGEPGGHENHTLNLAELPAHDHALSSHAHNIPALALDVRASSAAGTTVDPAGNVLATASVGGGGNPKVTRVYASGAANVSLGASGTTMPSVTDPASAMTGSTGGGQPHPVMSPFLTVRCIIALVGIYPARN
jgi:microcystin-dependent protein